MNYYAHTKEGIDESQWQPLIEHLQNTARLASQFGPNEEISQLAYIAGLIHDIGKYSQEFQCRLRGKKIRVDHSTAGAKELIEKYCGKKEEPLALLIAYCIAGHHAGMPDYGSPADVTGEGTLISRLKSPIPNYEAYQNEFDLNKLRFPQSLPIKHLRGNIGFTLSFLARMIFSALVDADFQETETYMRGQMPRGQYADITELTNKLNAYLQKFNNPASEINRKRSETLKTCIEKARYPKGFFTLTVPTGGGKTLSSMAFALNHAAHHGLNRVIYIIPYTTIIEQNAAIFKEIFGEKNVLEHHSNFDWEELKRAKVDNPDDTTHNIYSKLKLAAENWDIPIVVTTNVQFFESLFANKSSRCRKLHNIARSVLVFDEAQMLPREYMIPAISAVWELVNNYGATAVFCTATQPGLERFLPANTQLTELAPNPQQLFEFYKRVEVKNLGTLTDDELLKRLNHHKQVLCIVNTRRHASGLFEKLHGDGNYHLSTLMCPAHRKQTLAEIRSRLDSREPCRVISTTVMEAGIDMDFPTGYRALAGLDSINQAAGRVNRNMRFEKCDIYVFEPKSDFIEQTPRFIAQSTEITRQVLRSFPNELISIPAIEMYFQQLYSLHNRQAFDYKRIMDCFMDDQGRFMFQTAAQRFQVIEDITKPIIIPFNEEARGLIGQLKNSQFPKSVLRKLQPYTVSIYESEFNNLSAKGVIITIAEYYPVLEQSAFETYYDPQRGLILPESTGGEGLFF